jgi:methyl-accepting chemotaxis protein
LAAKFSIRAILGSVIGVLGLLLVALSAGALVGAIERDGNAQHLSTLVPITQQLFTALQNLRLERGQTSGALQAEAPVDADIGSKIAADRKRASASYDAAIGMLDKLALPRLAETLGRLKSTHEATLVAAQQADDAIKQSKSQRDAEIGRSYPAITQSYLDSLDATSRVIEDEISAIDPAVDELIAIKRAAWSSRTAAGAQAFLTTLALNGERGWAPQQALTYATERGREEAAWAIVGDAAMRASTSPIILDAYAKAQPHFSGAVADEREKVVALLSAGKKAEITSADFESRHVPLLSAVGNVAGAALDALGAHAEQQSSAARLSLALNGGMLVLALVLMTAGFLLVHRRVSQPLRRLTGAMRRLADHDLSVDVDGVERRDEIGEMSRAVQIFKDGMIEADKLAAEQQAEQNRKERRQQAVEGHISAFDRSVAASLQILSAASTELQTTSQTMSATAEQTSHKSAAVAAASEEASSNVQTVASSAEELSSSISEISRQVTESTRVAGQAVDEADRTNLQVKRLADAAQKIGDVVKLINDIAGQTNLLALNATIEAARAGEAGKGFAVVASEVKSLATQTSRATEDIAAQIGAIQEATGGAVQAIGSIGETIRQVNEIATAIAAAVEEQGVATQEIARNVQQAASGTGQVSINIAGVTEAAGETGAASTQVNNAAGELARIAATLRGEVDGFIANIRAA